MCAPSLLSEISHSAVFETVPMLVWLPMTLSRPFEKRWSSASSFFSSLLQASDDAIFVLGFVSAGRCLKLFNTSGLPKRKPLGIGALTERLSTQSFS